MEANHVRLRLPDGVRDDIRRAAAANGRSMNAEIIHRIAAYEVGEALTLRDYFAGQALPVVMDATGPLPSEFKKVAPDKLRLALAETAAAWSYAIADAMLAERSK